MKLVQMKLTKSFKDAGMKLVGDLHRNSTFKCYRRKIKVLTIFYIFAAFSVLGHLSAFLKNPFHCALSLVGTFCLGAIYVMLNAEFVAVIQVLIYEQ